MGVMKEMEVCCFFIPIRFGVALLAMGVFAHGGLMGLIYFDGDPRFLEGGYNPRFKWWTVTLGCLGVPFGLVGLLAVYDNKINWFKAFVIYQWCQVALAAVVYFEDRRTLLKCDQYIYSISSQTNENSQISALSNEAGLCGQALKAYQFGFTLDIFFKVYFAYVCTRYFLIINQIPAYLVRPKDTRDYDSDGRPPSQAYNPTTPMRLGEPSQYLIDWKAEAEYASLRADLEEKLYTSAMGDKEFVPGMVQGSAAGTAGYGAVGAPIRAGSGAPRR